MYSIKVLCDGFKTRCTIEFYTKVIHLVHCCILSIKIFLAHKQQLVRICKINEWIHQHPKIEHCLVNILGKLKRIIYFLKNENVILMGS